MSLTATTSISLPSSPWSQMARNTSRPMRPNPLIPTRIATVLLLLSSLVRLHPSARRGQTFPSWPVGRPLAPNESRIIAAVKRGDNGQVGTRRRAGHLGGERVPPGRRDLLVGGRFGQTFVLLRRVSPGVWHRAGPFFFAPASGSANSIFTFRGLRHLAVLCGRNHHFGRELITCGGQRAIGRFDRDGGLIFQVET